MLEQDLVNLDAPERAAVQSAVQERNPLQLGRHVVFVPLGIFAAAILVLSIGAGVAVLTALAVLALAITSYEKLRYQHVMDHCEGAIRKLAHNLEKRERVPETPMVSEASPAAVNATDVSESSQSELVQPDESLERPLH